MKDVVAPVLEDAIEQGLEIGFAYLSKWMEEKAIPKTKKKAKELTASAKLTIVGIKDGLTGKETKALQLLKEKEKTTNIAVTKSVEVGNIEPESEYSAEDKEVRSPEEIQKIINAMKSSAVTLAVCIRLLKKSVIADDGRDPEHLAELQKNFEELTTADIMDKIDLLLEDKNRNLLDQASLKMLAAFRENNFIVNGEVVPISNYISRKQ